MLQGTKLPAFTMIELLVVLVLSGIIFSMALLVLEIMGQQAGHQEQQHQEVLAIEQLQLLLKKDAYQAKEIWTTEEQLFFNYEAYRIQYQFKEQIICRTILQEPMHTDTFQLPSVNLERTWQRQPITFGRVDAFKVETTFFGALYSITIQKEYDSKTLLETYREQE